MLDIPNERSSHVVATPRGGGLVIIVLGVACLIIQSTTSLTPRLFLVFAALWTAWGALSWLDDTLELSAKKRFAIQFILAFTTVGLIGWVNELEWSADRAISLGWLGFFLSAVGLVWITNLYNFMDGIDGLAASQSIVAAVTFGFWFFTQGGTELAMLCWVVAASSYAFLLHNWQPAKVFMGDVGSIGLGFFFGLMLIIGHNRYGIPVLSSVMLLMVFIADTMLTLVRRAYRREALLQAHRSHYYQRLVIAGCSHRAVVTGYCAAMVLASVFASIGIFAPELLIPLFVGLASIMLLGAVAIASWTRSKY